MLHVTASAQRVIHSRDQFVNRNFAVIIRVPARTPRELAAIERGVNHRGNLVDSYGMVGVAIPDTLSGSSQSVAHVDQRFADKRHGTHP